MNTDPLSPEEQLILLSYRLKKTRLDKGWTQRALAKAIGSHENLINSYENQKHPPTLIVVLRVCQALGVTIGEILDETIPA